MESLDNEQLFDAITSAIKLGHCNAARYVFYDALSLAREEIIDNCVDLALKRRAYYLILDLEEMRKTYRSSN